jgi:hypothetical protein
MLSHPSYTEIIPNLSKNSGRHFDRMQTCSLPSRPSACQANVPYKSLEIGVRTFERIYESCPWRSSQRFSWRFIFLGIIDPEDEGEMMFRNVGNNLPTIAQHPRVLKSPLCFPLAYDQTLFSCCALTQAVSRWSLDCGGSSSIPRHYMWDLWWTTWYRDRFFSKYFGFALSTLFHQIFHTLSFIYVTLVIDIVPLYNLCNCHCH